MEPVRQANLSPRIWKAKNIYLERSLMGNICWDDNDDVSDGGGDFIMMVLVMLVSSNGDDGFDDVVSENLKG